MSHRRTDLTAGNLLARNVIWNTLGVGAPMLVGLIAIPILVKALGVPRFGVLTLAWMVVGYFSLFDLGLGRALTKLVAERLGEDRRAEIPTLIWTGMVMMLALGIIGAISVATIVPWLVEDLLKIPTSLQKETLVSFYLLAIGIPVIIAATGLRGVLEAHQRFGLVNAVRIPLGLVTFLGPLAVLPFSNSLVPVVVVLVVARICTLAAYLLFCRRVDPGLSSSIKFDAAQVKPMMTFGGWMTISNIVGPMMVYLDRFLIGSIISISAVAYYATPYEVVTKLWILPGALIGVLFPAFSTSVAANRDRAALLFDRSLHYCLLMLFPVVLVIMAFSEEALTVWLGVDFAINSTRVLQLLALGVFINSLARIPFAMVQSCGRPDLVAKAHLVELPFYLGALWLVLPVYGINGVATVWVARIAVDAIVFFIMCRHLLPQTILTIYRIGFALAVTTAILLVTFLLTAHLEKAAYVLFVSVGFLVVAWLKILTHRERTTILDLGRRCLPRP